MEMWMNSFLMRTWISSFVPGGTYPRSVWTTHHQPQNHWGLKPRIPEPQTSGRSRTPALSRDFPWGEFYARHGLRSSVPEKSQSYTNANMLGFLYIQTLEAKKKKIEVRSTEHKAASLHWENHLRRDSTPGQFCKPRVLSKAEPACFSLPPQASSTHTPRSPWIGQSEARAVRAKHQVSQCWFNGL